jgi:hypothetical protein
LQNPLREGAGAAGSRTQQRTHRVLIVAQMALALGLLATASLVRTYIGLYRVPLGYDTAHLMTMRVYFAGPRYEEATAREQGSTNSPWPARVGRRRGSTVSDLVPLDDQGDPTDLRVGPHVREGKEPTVQYAEWLAMAETFACAFSTAERFQPAELQGQDTRGPGQRDTRVGFWPGQNAIGQKFRIAEDEAAPWLTVIGVVPDIRTVKLDESRATPPTAYIPHRFISTHSYGIVIRTTADPASVIAGVRTAVRAIDPALALFDVYPMEQVRWLSYWMYVLWGTLFAVIGAIALVVASVGVYGVVFSTVAPHAIELTSRSASRPQVVGPMLGNPRCLRPQASPSAWSPHISSRLLVVS